MFNINILISDGKPAALWSSYTLITETETFSKCHSEKTLN